MSEWADRVGASGFSQLRPRINPNLAAVHPGRIRCTAPSMNREPTPIQPSAGTHARFQETHWSVVLAAADPRQAGAALETLCRTYWYPIYAFLRRQGRGPEEAKDLTQEFFVHLLGKQTLARADRERGKFRTFLLALLRNLVTDRHRREQAQKRGGGQEWISLDADEAERRFAREPATELDPEKIFSRRWAMTVVETVLARLAEDYRSRGKEALYAEIQDLLLDKKGAVSQGEIAARLGLKEGTLNSEVSRMRARFRELFRAEIAATVADPGQVDEEARDLFAILRS